MRASIQLAVVALTAAAGIVFAPVAASAHSSGGIVRGAAGPMAGKAQGHPSMAAAMSAHPELAHMRVAGRPMAGKAKGHPSMAAAMSAHPELARMRGAQAP